MKRYKSPYAFDYIPFKTGGWGIRKSKQDGFVLKDNAGRKVGSASTNNLAIRKAKQLLRNKGCKTDVIHIERSSGVVVRRKNIQHRRG